MAPEKPVRLKKDGTPWGKTGPKEGMPPKHLRKLVARGKEQRRINANVTSAFRQKPGLDGEIFGVELPTRGDMLPRESKTAFRAFVCYCDLGPKRTVGEVLRRLRWYGKELTYDILLDWHQEFRWDERFDAWEKVQTEKINARVKETAERLKPIDVDLADRLIKYGLKILNSSSAYESAFARDGAAMVKTGVDIRRVALGQATEIKETKVDPEIETVIREIQEKFGKMSIEELRRERAELANRATLSCGGEEAHASGQDDSASGEARPDPDRPVPEAGSVH